jgi:hypothetical protein
LIDQILLVIPHLDIDIGGQLEGRQKDCMHVPPAEAQDVFGGSHESLIDLAHQAGAQEQVHAGAQQDQRGPARDRSCATVHESIS